MSNTARLYRIEALIRQHGSVAMRDLMDHLEASRATIKRDLEYLRSQLGAPIEYDTSTHGYRFATGYQGRRQELPGLWFDERELYSLLMANQLLSEVDSSALLGRHLQPLLERIHQMIGAGDREIAGVLMSRVKIVSALRRPVAPAHFERASEALMKRKRLFMRYRTRGRKTTTEREVSPQRLVHYRSTWYLDAWCHSVDALRRFALDAIEVAQVLPSAAMEVATQDLEAAMDAGYGIYAGGTRQWARLLFDAQAAPWISREHWHPDQTGRWHDDGTFELRLPFVDDTELIMDLLRQADQVRVLEPKSLRLKFEERLERALRMSRSVDTKISLET